MTHISYQLTSNFAASAQLTYDNMRTYYQHYGVDWQHAHIIEQIKGLQNWDIVINGQVIGAIRLAFDDAGCYLRDLQVDAGYQNKGIGEKALLECQRLAKSAGVTALRMRVFKISPAHHLYTRMGFGVDSEEERFYYMSLKL
ncbi:GNAT family N-acetyltransferase [Thalassotalea maritima]|uniref:GNAT family N-acetyltransferase n=1 Tax=Thalassotalea maritima TaxID=3242416 RepID=UPI0035289CB0